MRPTGETNQPRLIDEYATAAFAGVSVATIRRWRARRRRGDGGALVGPAFIELGASIRYDQHDLDAWVAALPRAGAAKCAR